MASEKVQGMVQTLEIDDTLEHVKLTSNPKVEKVVLRGMTESAQLGLPERRKDEVRV